MPLEYDRFSRIDDCCMLNALPRFILQYLHIIVGNEEYLHQMALAVSVEVCGRLGLAPPADAADRLNGLRAHIPAGEERRALEEVREMAKVFGDTVCKELDLLRPRSDLQRTEER